MSAVVLFLIIVLQLEAGASGAGVYLYHKVGDNATLQCKSAPPSSPPALVSWLYNADMTQTLYEVWNGNGFRPSPREDRVSLNSDLSLVIINITAEDAGRYSCRSGASPETDMFVYLSVLTISPISPVAEPNRGNPVRVECSLLRIFDIPPCGENSLRWVDETGGVLDRCVFRGHTKCSSVLTVEPHSGRSRTYTCQFVQEQAVKIESHYTLMGSTDWSPLSFIMLALRVTALILMTGVTVAVNRTRANKMFLTGISACGHEDDEEADSAEIYENV